MVARAILLVSLLSGLSGCSQYFKVDKTKFSIAKISAPSGPSSPFPTPAPTPTPTSPPSGPGGCTDPQVDAFCRGDRQPPNVFGTIQSLANQYPTELSHCDRHNYEFSHIVANTLRAQDPRWGLNWVRGNIGDETGDIIGYYYGPGAPQNNSPYSVIIDFIGSCGGDNNVQWGVIAPADYNSCCNPNGSVKWTIEPL